MTNGELRQLEAWNETGTEYPKTQCVHQLFEEQARLTPGKVAIKFGGSRLTYGELNARANQLAHYLNKQGGRPGMVVGTCVERSLEMVVGLLGILKAGGAYASLILIAQGAPRPYVARFGRASFIDTAKTAELLPDSSRLRPIQISKAAAHQIGHELGKPFHGKAWLIRNAR